MTDALDVPIATTTATLDLSDILPAASKTPDTGDCVGDCKLGEKLGEGGMGIVFKAENLKLRRTEALKLIKLSRPSDQTAFLTRFRLEAQAVAALQSDHIVKIYQAGEHESHPYFSMEFIEGTDLKKELEKECGVPLQLHRAAKLMKEIARAVHHAHERGILHRDLKPGNILLDKAEKPYVTDFGLSKFVHRESKAQDVTIADGPCPDSELTTTGHGFGTIGYTSPEQASGQHPDVTAASDLFSLGAIFYQMITGHRAYPTNDWSEFIRRAGTGEFQRPSHLNRAVDADLEAICVNCLEPNPQRRASSAQELADQLDHWLNQVPLDESWRKTPLWERGTKWVRRHPIKLGLMITATASVLLAASLVNQWQRTAQQRYEREFGERRLALKTAEDHFVQHRADLALEVLAQAIRRRPDNRAAAERLLNALNQRTFLVPLSSPLLLPADTGDLSPDRTRRVFGRDTNAITVVDIRDSHVLVPISNAHQRVIRDVRFSPDGLRLVSAGADSNVAVWNAITGERQVTIPHSAGVNHTEFSPDGSLILSASRDNTARLWDTNGMPAGNGMFHDSSVSTARFSSDGRFILTASHDYTIRLWNARTTTPYSEPGRLSTAVIDARFVPGGRHIVATTFDDRINAFFITRSEPIASAQQTDYTLARARSRSRLGDWRQRITAHFTREILDIDLSPDERILAAGCVDGVRLLFTRTLVQKGDSLDHQAKVNCVRFSPDGLRLVTSTSRGEVRLWDVETGQPLSDSEPFEDLLGVEFSADGGWVITSTGWKFEVPRLGGLNGSVGRDTQAVRVPEWLPELVKTLVPPVTESTIQNEPGAADSLDRWRKLPPTNQAALWVRRAFAEDKE